MQLEKHYVNRVGWLRAAVLGANDGIISTTSIVIGVAAASTTREPILLAALAGLVAGAMSMAAGEYVSVSSQEDTEKADIEREKKELENMPEIELQELAKIYERRGLRKELSIQVAEELTAHDALDAHMRDELGINEITTAKPLVAAMASLAAFVAGGLLPFLVALFAPVKQMILYEYVMAIIFLIILGSVAAKTGGSGTRKAVIRVCLWGTLAMIASALVGYLFGVQVG